MPKTPHDAPTPVGPSNRRRLAVTALAPLVVIAGGHVGVAGLDHSSVAGLLVTLPASWGIGSAPGFSILGLGIAPLVAAYLLVELAALVVPRWRALRHDGIEGRASLERAATRLALVIASIQALQMARAAQAADLLAGSGLLPPLLFSLSLVAGVSLLMLVARVVRAHGLGNGMAVVVVSALLVAEIASMRNQAARVGGVGALDLVFAALVTLPLAAVTLLALGIRPRGRIDEPAAPESDDGVGIDYRSTARRPADLDAPLPVPASGAVPFWAPAVLVAPPAMLLPLSARTGLPSWSSLDATVAVPIEIALTAALVVILSILFNRPSRVAAIRAAATRTIGDDIRGAPAESEARTELRDAVVRTLAFAGSVTAIHLGASAYLPLVPAAVPVVLATALAVDLAAEWRARRPRHDLVSVWAEHRPHAVAPAAAALAAEGIEMHARGMHHRTMLQALGPWAPIELLVPGADADKARGILAGVVGAGAKVTKRPRAEDAGTETPVQYPKRTEKRVRTAGRS